MLFSFENLFSKMYHMEKKAISKERKYNFVGNSLMLAFLENENLERILSQLLFLLLFRLLFLFSTRGRAASFINKHPRLDLFLFLMSALPPCTKRTLGIF